MFNNENKKIAFVLTSITVINSIFASLISLIIFCLIVYHISRNPMRKRDKVILLLCGNIYLCILIYMIILSSMNIQTILGDLYEQNFESSWCKFVGYMSPTILCVLYYSFVNQVRILESFVRLNEDLQAFFRLCRIVYTRYKWLQFYSIYIIIPSVQLVLAFIFLSPLLYWNDVIYLFDEHYCYAAFSNIRGIVWTAAMAYGIPGLCLLIIYIRIIRFLREHSNNQTQAVQRRQARDLLVIRRILTVVGVLIILGIPSVILVLIAAITGKEHPLSFRITWISLTVSMTGLSITMIFFIPQLKNILWKFLQQNQVNPIVTNQPIPCRPVPNSTN